MSNLKDDLLSNKGKRLTTKNHIKSPNDDILIADRPSYPYQVKTPATKDLKGLFPFLRDAHLHQQTFQAPFYVGPSLRSIPNVQSTAQLVDDVYKPLLEAFSKQDKHETKVAERVTLPKDPRYLDYFDDDRVRDPVLRKAMEGLPRKLTLEEINVLEAISNKSDEAPFAPATKYVPSSTQVSSKVTDMGIKGIFSSGKSTQQNLHEPGGQTQSAAAQQSHANQDSAKTSSALNGAAKTTAQVMHVVEGVDENLYGQFGPLKNPIFSELPFLAITHPSQVAYLSSLLPKGFKVTKDTQQMSADPSAMNLTVNNPEVVDEALSLLKILRGRYQTMKADLRKKRRAERAAHNEEMSDSSSDGSETGSDEDSESNTRQRRKKQNKQRMQSSTDIDQGSEGPESSPKGGMGKKEILKGKKEMGSKGRKDKPMTETKDLDAQSISRELDTTTKVTFEDTVQEEEKNVALNVEVAALPGSDQEDELKKEMRKKNTKGKSGKKTKTREEGTCNLLNTITAPCRVAVLFASVVWAAERDGSIVLRDSSTGDVINRVMTTSAVLALAVVHL